MPNILEFLSKLGTGLGGMEPNFRTPPFVPHGINQSPIYGGGYQSFPEIPNLAPQPYQPPMDVLKILQELYQPETGMRTQFESLMNNFPQPQEPSNWRKFGSVLAGLGGENAAQSMAISNQFIRQPYYNRLEEFAAQADPLMKGMVNEQQYNQNQRLFAEQSFQRMIEQGRLREAERRNREQEALSAERNEIARINAATSRFRAENPGLRIVLPKGGYVTAIDPITGESKFITDESGKPIHTGTLSDEALANIRGQWSVNAANARGANAIATEETRQEGRENLQWDIFQQGGKTYRINKATGEVQEVTVPEGVLNRPGTPPTSRGTTGESELEKERRARNRRQQMMIERPDLYNWIDPATGTFKRGVPENIRQEINQYIYGETRPGPAMSGVPFNPPGSSGTSGNQNLKAPPNIPLIRPSDRAILMVDRNGQFGYVPAAQVAAAEAQGYRKAQ